MSGEQNLWGQIVVGVGISSETGPKTTRDTFDHETGVANVAQRGWEAAETTRLNAAHWSAVSGNDNINLDLQPDLQTLQRRCRHESINNGLIEGALETHATDVVGSECPGLQLLTDDDNFNNSVEQLWEEWAESCEHQHGLALVDLLHGWVNQWWFHGEFLIQEIVGRRATDYRLHDIGAEMIDLYHSAENIVLGIELDASKAVAGYWIADPITRARTRLDGSYAIHAFRRRFAGQMRGIPLLASTLQDAADLNDYDDQVMDAARAAADGATWMVTDHPDSEFVPVKSGTYADIKRRQIRHAAPGWRPMQMQANQPQTQYVDFRTERQREIGAPAQMPLIVLRRDASKSNFSSARFDSSGYWRAIDRFQKFLERRALNKILRRYVRLASWQGLIPPIPPRLIFSWTWPKPPAIDPVKETVAERMGLENGTVSYTDALAARGKRRDRVIAQRRRDNDDLLAAGLAPIQGAVPMTAADFVAVVNSELGANNADQNTQNANQ